MFLYEEGTRYNLIELASLVLIDAGNRNFLRRILHFLAVARLEVLEA